MRLLRARPHAPREPILAFSIARDLSTIRGSLQFRSAVVPAPPTSRVGWAKAHRRAAQPAQPLMRLCPRRPTSPFDRVGKVALGRGATPSAAAGDFAHPTGL